jgi:hypothetical protein
LNENPSSLNENPSSLNENHSPLIEIRSALIENHSKCQQIGRRTRNLDHIHAEVINTKTPGCRDAEIFSGVPIGI